MILEFLLLGNSLDLVQACVISEGGQRPCVAHGSRD